MKFSFNLLLNYLAQSIKLQLFLTIASAPILIYWGLPISKLTLLGNILLAPLLVVFLTISSLIFFLELLQLPNQFPIFLLEKLCQLWLKIELKNPQTYLMYFPQSSWICFALAIIIAISILIKHNRLAKQLLLLIGLFWICMAIAKLPIWLDTNYLELTYRKQKIKISLVEGELILHDYGTLNYPMGTESWILYQLLPNLAQKFGTIEIAKLYLDHPSKSTAKNLEILQEYAIVKKVITN